MTLFNKISRFSFLGLIAMVALSALAACSDNKSSKNRDRGYRRSDYRNRNVRGFRGTQAPMQRRIQPPIQQFQKSNRDNDFLRELEKSRKESKEIVKPKKEEAKSGPHSDFVIVPDREGNPSVVRTRENMKFDVPIGVSDSLTGGTYENRPFIDAKPDGVMQLLKARMKEEFQGEELQPYLKSSLEMARAMENVFVTVRKNDKGQQEMVIKFRLHEGEDLYEGELVGELDGRKGANLFGNAEAKKDQNMTSPSDKIYHFQARARCLDADGQCTQVAVVLEQRNGVTIRGDLQPQFEKLDVEDICKKVYFVHRWSQDRRNDGAAFYFLGGDENSFGFRQLYYEATDRSRPYRNTKSENACIEDKNAKTTPKKVRNGENPFFVHFMEYLVNTVEVNEDFECNGGQYTRPIPAKSARSLTARAWAVAYGASRLEFTFKSQVPDSRNPRVAQPEESISLADDLTFYVYLFDNRLAPVYDWPLEFGSSNLEYMVSGSPFIVSQSYAADIRSVWLDQNDENGNTVLKLQFHGTPQREMPLTLETDFPVANPSYVP